MGCRKGKKRRQGHYCWCCDQFRPNERFSGKGHGKHICRQCARLGTEELRFRQDLRNLQRCMTWEGFIPRKRKRTFAQYLEHADPRVRECAWEMYADDLCRRQRALLEREGFYLFLSEPSHDQEWDAASDEYWLEDADDRPAPKKYKPGHKPNLFFVYDYPLLSSCATSTGIIPREKRKTFASFLEHPHPEIREKAWEMHAADVCQRSRLEVDRECVLFFSSGPYRCDSSADPYARELGDPHDPVSRDRPSPSVIEKVVGMP